MGTGEDQAVGKDKSKRHQVLGPGHTHSDISMDSAPQNGQAFAALEGTCEHSELAVPGNLQTWLEFWKRTWSFLRKWLP